MFMINTIISEGTKALLGKRKIEEYESQLNPKRHDASRRRVVSDEPIRAEPIREIKPPVRRKPVRRECGVTPEWLVNLMRKENGVDAKLITVKDLKASDLKIDQARLLLPFNQITEMDFLNEAVLNIIEEHRNNIRNKGVDVILVDSRGKQWKLNLRSWDMKTSSNYVLVSGWNKVFLRNKLNVGQSIRLWSFHSHDRLYFALNPPPPTQAMAQVPDAVPVPGPAMASDPDMALAPAMAQAQAPVPATGSSSTPAPVVTRDSDDLGQSIL